MQLPSVSIIIVNWNHGQYLRKCLDLLFAQEYHLFEIFIVDNGSQDGSPNMIKDEYPGVKIWTFPDNRGFSKALNWGVNQTTSDFVVSLNPDVFVMRNFLQEMVNVMCQDESIGIVSAKLLRDDDSTTLDSTGLFLNHFRRPYDRGQGEIDSGQYDRTLQIFGACGAAALYRRSMLVDIAVEGEFFDEDFFTYYEDADLAWRAQMRGWNGRYAPRAVATHVRGSGDTLRKVKTSTKNIDGPRLALRNRWLMTLKNDALRYLLLDFPFIFVMELSRLLYMAIFAPNALLGLKDILVGFRTALDKRNKIRGRMVIDDATLRPWFKPQKLPYQKFG